MSASRAAHRLLFALLVVVLLVLVASGCGGDDSGSSDGGSDESAQSGEDEGGEDGPSKEVMARDGKYDAAPTEELDPSKDYVVRMETNKGSFDITVDPKAAPIAASNFVFLVKDGFYDGVVFHRIMEDFMIQSGDPLGTGTGGPGYTIKDEPVQGKYVNGAVAMARTAAPNSAGSQFFIVHGDTGDQALGREYVIFGQVTKGLDVVDEIATVEVTESETGEPSKPVDTVRIESAKLL